MATKKQRYSSHIFDKQISQSSALDDDEEVKVVESENKTSQATPSPKQSPSSPNTTQSEKKKELIIGETLIGKTNVKINGEKLELEIYYGNFVKPMVYNEKTNQYEFKTYKKEQYLIMLEEFLNTLEGFEYRVPSQEEIEEACEKVKEKERAFLDKMKNAQQKTEPENNTVEEENLTEENKQPVESKGEQSQEDDKKELKYCGNVKSYKEEQMDKYRKKNFNPEQLHQIQLGLEAGLDVEYYAYENVPPEAMEKMRKKQQYDLGAVSEAKEKFNQDYSDEKEKLEEEILEKQEEPEKPKKDLTKAKEVGKAASSAIAIVIIGLLTVALCIVVVTILLQAFKEYSTGLFG